MGNRIGIEEKINGKEALQKTAVLGNHAANGTSSNQQSPCSSSSSNRSTDRVVKKLRNHSRTSTSPHISSLVYDESEEGEFPPCEGSKTHAKCGSNGMKLLVRSSPVPSPMNSARRDTNTKVITIPASSLDCPSLHGMGLSISPMNSFRRNSPANTARISPMATARNNSLSVPSSPPVSPPNVSSLMKHKNSTMPTILSALNFAETEENLMLNETDDDYCVSYFSTTTY